MLGEEFDRLSTTRDAQRLPFTRLLPGQRVKVRFLWEFPKRLVLWRHERVPKADGGGYMRVSCALNAEYAEAAGGVCVYCKEGYPRRAVSFFLVWNYDTSQIEICSARNTSYSFLPALQEMYASDGTITNRDWIVVRKPDESRERVSRYIALPGAPTSFSLPPDVSVPTHADVIAALAPRELRR